MRKSSGYTMVLFLAFIASVLLAGFSLYDNGTVAAERIRMQNTTDATVYSTVNVISRDMNFIAYTNRSMVANQVAIGQMVGLSSWTHMLDTAVSNLDKVMSIIGVIPVIGQALKAATTAMAKFSAMAKKVVDKSAKLGITATDILIGVLSKAQIAFQGGTVAMAMSTYNDVAKANDKDVETNLLVGGATLAKVLQSWDKNVQLNHDPKTGNKTKVKAVRERFQEFADVVQSSRDPFSQNRSYFWFKWTTLLNIIILKNKMSIQKKGGTDFMEIESAKGGGFGGAGKKLKWEWTAMDNVSIWHYAQWWGKCGKWNPIPCKKDSTNEILPVGWGAGHALADNKKFYNYSKYKPFKKKWNWNEWAWSKPPKGQYQNFHEQGHQGKLRKWEHWGDGEYAWKNKWSNGIAALTDGNNNLKNIKGLRTFFDLKSNTKKDTGPNMVALLNKKTKKIRVQETLDKTDAKYNRPDLFKIEKDGGIVNDTLYGVAKAETYFSRPRDLWKRADGYREYGNLYNPFWQTRLIDTTNKERFAAVFAANLLK